MENAFTRTISLIGEEKLNKINNAHVAIFGLGGVGGYVLESLARCGVGSFTLIDNDVFSVSNLNRQVLSTYDVIGKDKVEIAKKRVLSINPNCKVNTLKCFVLPGQHNIDFSSFDYVVDAIDTISGKLEIIERAKEKNIPVISSMGTGNKLDASKFQITDISKTHTCPLAKVMRKLLKERGIDSVKVLFSTELPITPKINIEDQRGTKVTPGSISYVPAVAGLLISQEVIKDLSSI